MAELTYVQGARGSSVLNLGTLASGTYIGTGSMDLGANIKHDHIVEVEFDPNGTPTGNRMMMVFAKLSADNTNWSSGPNSGTTVTEEPDLHPIGTVPGNDTNTHRKQFSLRVAGIPIIRYVEIVVKSDLGVALTSGNIFFYPVEAHSV